MTNLTALRWACERASACIEKLEIASLRRNDVQADLAQRKLDEALALLRSELEKVEAVEA